MYCINKVHLSGKIKWLKEIPTKTGTRMASFMLESHKASFNIVCFSEIADTVLQDFGDNDFIEIRGSAQNHNFTQADGTKVYTLQIVVNQLGNDEPERNDQLAAQRQERPPADQGPRSWIPTGQGGPF